jgi:hypothetical protein
MKVVTPPEVDVEQLMQSIRDELAGRRKYRAAPSRRKQLFLSEPLSSSAQPPFPVHEENSYRLRDFLKYDGPDFIQAAYQGILNREADTSGFENYLTLLRSGASKVEILGRIRNSLEGKRRGAKVQGLAAMFILHWILKVPVVGRVIGIAVAIWDSPATERRYRRLACEFACWRVQSEREFLRTTHNLHEALRTLEHSQNLTSDLVHAVADTHLEAVRQTLAEVTADLDAVKQTLLGAAEIKKDRPVS